jgi:hypothetical protein
MGYGTLWRHVVVPLYSLFKFDHKTIEEITKLEKLYVWISSSGRIEHLEAFMKIMTL